MDYKSVFTNLCLELQQNRSWIKGLGKNPQKSELIHWRQCLLSGGTEACSLRFRETPACIHVIQFYFRPPIGRVIMLLVAVTNMGWRVYTQVFLGVRGNTLQCPQTKGTVDFCLIPYPGHILLTFQPQICKDVFISIVFDVSPECCLFDRVRADNSWNVNEWGVYLVVRTSFHW